MRILLMVLGFLFLAVPPVSAAVYQQGIVYVIYEEEGDNAIKNSADINENGVPDRVEDIATQVNAARELFNSVFDFPDPLASERFKNVKTIEIDIVAKETMKVNGQAFSGVRKKSKHNPDESAIHIKVANTVNPHKNSTPAHEYFHLIQYGETYFRNAWFLEGMARWAQDSVMKIKKYPDGKNVSFKLKSNLSEKQIFQGKYNVSNLLWYPLAVGMKDKATIPGKLMKKYKYVDGAAVFQDDIIYGPNVMREVIRVMKSKENLAASEFGVTLKEWRKKGQRDERNNKIILDCVREVYNSKK